MAYDDALFIGGVLNVVKELREAGLDDVKIACILCDVRAAAIREERQRFDNLNHGNPPVFPRWGDMMDAFKDYDK